jgi:O-antigen/teichoic acid export membrane protein
VITKVLRNTVWLGIGEAAIKGALFAAMILIARGSGPAGVGTFSVAFSAAVVAVLILALGQQEVLIREVARSPRNARNLVRGSGSLQFRYGRWLVIAALISIFFVNDRDLRLALLAFVPYAALRTATVTRGAAFKGLDRMDVETRARGLEVVVAIGLIAMCLGFGWPVWTAGAAFSIGAGTGLLWLGRRLGELRREGAPVNQAVMLAEGWPFMALAVASQLLTHADRFLLALCGVSAADIGFWGAAGTTVWATMALPQLIAVSVYPSLSRMAEKGGSTRRIGVVAAIAGGSVGLVVALVLWLFGGALIRLAFGSEFGPAAPLLERASWALPGAFAMMVLGSVLAAWRQQRRSLWVMAAALGLSVALNLYWIPKQGVLAPASIVPLVYNLAAVALVFSLFWFRDPDAEDR